MYILAPRSSAPSRSSSPRPASRTKHNNNNNNNTNENDNNNNNNNNDDNNISVIVNVVIIVIIINPHLGLMNAPPLICSPQNDLFHYSFIIKKARHILNSVQDFINTFLRHGRYQLCHLGGHLGGHPFSLKARPPQK